MRKVSGIPNSSEVVGVAKLRVPYLQLLLQLKDPCDNYYELLVAYSSHILTEVDLFGQTKVAKEIVMSQSKLSNLIPVLRSIAVNDVSSPMLYYIEDAFENIWKIGVSNDIATRVNSIRYVGELCDEHSYKDGEVVTYSGNAKYVHALYPTVLKTWSFKSMKEAREVETVIKKIYIDSCIQGNSEIFTPIVGLERIDNAVATCVSITTRSENDKRND